MGQSSDERGRKTQRAGKPRAPGFGSQVTETKPTGRGLDGLRLIRALHARALLCQSAGHWRASIVPSRDTDTVPIAL